VFCLSTCGHTYHEAEWARELRFKVTIDCEKLKARIASQCPALQGLPPCRPPPETRAEGDEIKAAAKAARDVYVNNLNFFKTFSIFCSTGSLTQNPFL
jgi:hypothetical protein